MKRRPGAQPATIRFVAIFATALSVAATLGQFGPGVLASFFERDLGISPGMIGVFTSVIFGVSALASVPAGWSADRISPPTLVLIQASLATAALVGYTSAQNETHLFITCAIVGLSMATHQPLTNRVVVAYLPPAKRAQAVGWKSLGPQIGSVLLGTTFGLTGNTVFWRYTMLAFAAALLVFTVWAFLALRRRAQYAERPRVTGTGGEIRHPTTARATPLAWWLIPYAFFATAPMASIVSYLMLFGSSALDLTVSTASFALTLISGSSVLARLVFVRIVNERNAVCALIATGLCSAGAALVLASSPYLGVLTFWVGVALLGIFGPGSNPLIYVVLMANTPPRIIGILTSWVSFAAFVGMVVQPLIMSAVVQLVGIDFIWYPVSAATAIAGLTMILYAIIQPRRRRSRH